MDQKKEENICRVLAKGGRILTIPPIIVTIFLFILWNYKENIYHNVAELYFSVFFLGIMPVLAYAVHFIVPSFRKRGRALQRTMAFVFTLVGYLSAFIYGKFTNVEIWLQMIYSAYFLGVIFLSVMNYIFKKKASGYVCSFIEPVIMLFLFSLPKWAFLFAAMGIISIWSSLCLKRHRAEELLWGGCCGVLAAILSIVLYGKG